MASYLSSLLYKLLLCDFTTRVTVRRVFNFCCAHILQEENHSNLPQAVSHCLIIYKYICICVCVCMCVYIYHNSYTVKNITFLMYVSEAPASSREANPAPLFCCICMSCQTTAALKMEETFCPLFEAAEAHILKRWWCHVKWMAFIPQ